MNCPVCRAPALNETETVETNDVVPEQLSYRWVADCPGHGRFGAHQQGHLFSPYGIEPDETPSGWCARCTEPCKRSRTRPFGLLAWSGWCDMCRVTSWSMRKAARTGGADASPSSPDAMRAELSPSWLDVDD